MQLQAQQLARQQAEAEAVEEARASAAAEQTAAAARAGYQVRRIQHLRRGIAPSPRGCNGRLGAAHASWATFRAVSLPSPPAPIAAAAAMLARTPKRACMYGVHVL